MNITALNQFLKLILVLCLAGGLTACADKEVEYTGILDHRPEGKDGMWVIDGKSFSVTEDVELDEDDGVLKIGTCVGLEMEDGDVTEIETMKMEECQKEKIALD
jgi:hypothetical protein